MTTTAAPATNASPRIVWDTETCARCGGTGEHPSSLDGGRCWGCARQGRMRTKAADAARAVYVEVTTALRRVPAADVKVGDRIALNGTDRARRVLNITYRERTSGRPGPDGVVVWEDGWAFGTGGTSYQVARSRYVYRALTHDDVLAGVAAIADRDGYRLELREA